MLKCNPSRLPSDLLALSHYAKQRQASPEQLQPQRDSSPTAFTRHETEAPTAGAGEPREPGPRAVSDKLLPHQATTEEPTQPAWRKARRWGSTTPNWDTLPAPEEPHPAPRGAGGGAG